MSIVEACNFRREFRTSRTFSIDGFSDCGRGDERTVSKQSLKCAPGKSCLQLCLEGCPTYWALFLRFLNFSPPKKQAHNRSFRTSAHEAFLHISLGWMCRSLGCVDGGRRTCLEGSNDDHWSRRNLPDLAAIPRSCYVPAMASCLRNIDRPRTRLKRPRTSRTSYTDGFGIIYRENPRDSGSVRRWEVL